MGKPDVRNFRGGAGNRAMADLNRHEAGNGGYGIREPKATAPVLYSTRLNRWVRDTSTAQRGGLRMVAKQDS